MVNKKAHNHKDTHDANESHPALPILDEYAKNRPDQFEPAFRRQLEKKWKLKKGAIDMLLNAIETGLSPDTRCRLQEKYRSSVEPDVIASLEALRACEFNEKIRPALARRLPETEIRILEKLAFKLRPLPELKIKAEQERELIEKRRKWVNKFEEILDDQLEIELIFEPGYCALQNNLTKHLDAYKRFMAERRTRKDHAGNRELRLGRLTCAVASILIRNGISIKRGSEDFKEVLGLVLEGVGLNGKSARTLIDKAHLQKLIRLKDFKEEIFYDPDADGLNHLDDSEYEVHYDPEAERPTRTN